ncbi:DnaJ domain-containing protein [Myxococcota bacterium]|nr:DnaJ domain-containing protein [Myxococcota bacterium]
MRDPRKFKKWLIALALLYLVFPRDLVPDFLGSGLGLIDDLLLAAWLAYFYRKRLRKYDEFDSRYESGENQWENSDPEPEGGAQNALDPYEVLEIDATASRDEIQAAYKARMHEYHPDKVAHLGEELQRVAHRKALEIQHAYERLK